MFFNNTNSKLGPETYSRFYTFVVFEIAAPRINPVDILYEGDEALDFFHKVYQEITQLEQIKYDILDNNMRKITQMIELSASTEHIIVTKFFDKIWKRYTHVSTLGEPLIDIKII